MGIRNRTDLGGREMKMTLTDQIIRNGVPSRIHLPESSPLPTATQIARRLLASPASVSSILKKLVDRGRITRGRATTLHSDQRRFQQIGRKRLPAWRYWQ